MIISIYCGHEECSIEFDVNLANFDCENDGASGNHTTFYTYTGSVACPEGHENELTIRTDEGNDDELFNIISIDFD